MAQPSELTLQTLYDLSGRVALVTGGGSGIGAMIAEGLAANGARVYVCGRRKEALERVVGLQEGSKGVIIPLVMDVTSKESILAGVGELERREGRLHILVNNAGQVGPVSLFFNDTSNAAHKDAGTLGRALFDNESFEGWGALYGVNTFSIFFATTAFLGLLAQGSAEVAGYTSSVVNITSVSGLMKIAQEHFCYNSSKAAAGHLTKLLSTEFALKGIPVRVNAVAPGPYESEMTIAMATAEETHRCFKGVTPVPAGRPGNAQEMVGTVVYLASRAGTYTNGQEIAVDGGAVAVNPSTR